MFTHNVWQSLVLLASIPFAKSLDFKGADYSSLINLENSGITYSADGTSVYFLILLTIILIFCFSRKIRHDSR